MPETMACRVLTFIRSFRPCPREGGAAPTAPFGMSHLGACKPSEPDNHKRLPLSKVLGKVDGHVGIYIFRYRIQQ